MHSIFLLSLLLFSCAKCQDDGQQAARLTKLVNGTLPNAAAFQGAATQQGSADSVAGRLRVPATVSYCSISSFGASVYATLPFYCTQQAQFSCMCIWLQIKQLHVVCELQLMTKAAYLLYGVRLQATASSSATTPTGILRLGLSPGGRDGYVFVPPSYRQSAACALIVVLHGAGKGGLDGLGVLIDQANSSGAHYCTVSVSKDSLDASVSFAPLLGCAASAGSVLSSCQAPALSHPYRPPTLGSGPQGMRCKLLIPAHLQPHLGVMRTSLRCCAGIILLAPDSRSATWDWFASSSFGADVMFIGAALAQTRALYNTDPRRQGMQGFSDGATYALSLGAWLPPRSCDSRSVDVLKRLVSRCRVHVTIFRTIVGHKAYAVLACVAGPHSLSSNI